MSLKLYAHPFSSYCQKVLTALYENQTPFDYRNLEDVQANAELTALWPMRRFPVLVDGDHTVLEATCVIEYLDLHYPGPAKLIPEDRDAALEVRMLDRFFDHYISTPQQKVVADRLRPEADRFAVAAELTGQNFGSQGQPGTVQIIRAGSDFYGFRVVAGLSKAAARWVP